MTTPVCPICLDDEGDSSDLCLPCFHWFHRSCWNRWGKFICPVCREVPKFSNPSVESGTKLQPGQITLRTSQQSPGGNAGFITSSGSITSGAITMGQIISGTSQSFDRNIGFITSGPIATGQITSGIGAVNIQTGQPLDDNGVNINFSTVPTSSLQTTPGRIRILVAGAANTGKTTSVIKCIIWIREQFDRICVVTHQSDLIKYRHNLGWIHDIRFCETIEEAGQDLEHALVVMDEVSVSDDWFRRHRQTSVIFVTTRPQRIVCDHFTKYVVHHQPYLDQTLRTICGGFNTESLRTQIVEGIRADELYGAMVLTLVDDNGIALNPFNSYNIRIG